MYTQKALKIQENRLASWAPAQSPDPLRELTRAYSALPDSQASGEEASCPPKPLPRFRPYGPW